MPCCSFHMLLSHRQPRSGALLQLCSGFVLLKGRYCCLLRVQHLYVSLSGVYPDDVQDTDKFHFPSMFSSLLDKQAGSHLLLRLEVVSFVLPCVGARRLVHRALGTPGCLLPPSISLPGRGTKRRHGRSWAWTCRFSTSLWWHLKTSVLESQYLHLALFLLSVQLGVSPLSAFPCKAALLFSLGINNRSFTPCMKLSNLTAQWGSLANSPEFCHTELDKALHMVIRE